MKFLNSLGAGLAALVSVAAADDAAILYKEIARNANQSLLWGPYRPNLYFGVRPRIPKSLMGGLMWSKVENFQDVQNSKYLSHFGN
jgi:mannosyl-oligosaccharide glucosidase